MYPRRGEVLHFSEDPTITRFVPHVAPTATERGAYVWAVDSINAPSYWFPRECPRAAAWIGPNTTGADCTSILGPAGATRVHAIEYRWLEALRAVRLFAYRFDAGAFQPIGAPRPHAYVATEPIDPIAPAEPVGNLLDAHARAGIELRVLANLWGFWDAVIASTLEFSGLRLSNARPRPGSGPREFRAASRGPELTTRSSRDGSTAGGV